MAKLPDKSNFTDSGVNQAGFRNATNIAIAFLAGLLGTNGTAADARAKLGLKSGATTTVGTAATKDADEFLAVDGLASDSNLFQGKTGSYYLNSSNQNAGTLPAARIPDSMKPLGVDQTWQDKLSSRSLGTTYTNTTGRPILVSATIQKLSGNDSLSVGIKVDSAWVSSPNNPAGGSKYLTIQAVVPNGSTYRVVADQQDAVAYYWYELS